MELLLGPSQANPTKRDVSPKADREGLARRIAAHLQLADANHGRLRDEQFDDLRACLYGLHSVLRLHFAQEEENYFSLAH
ncbi:hypothetical protein [Kitasatospora aureofaciens]|uniref:hypothetical protein n=1 Tax=Kitasatospora aureofaciens TaxID=1894 RepID=UPI003F4D3065